MNKSQIIALYNQDQRSDIEYPNMRREMTSNVVRHIDTSGVGEGAVIFSQLNHINAEDVIREQVSYFESIGQDFEWKVYDYDNPSDLKDAPEILGQPVRHTVERILHPEKLSDVLSIEQQVWDKDFSGLGHYLEETLRKYPQQTSLHLYGGEEENNFPLSWGSWKKITIRLYDDRGASRWIDQPSNKRHRPVADPVYVIGYPLGWAPSGTNKSSPAFWRTCSIASEIDKIVKARAGAFFIDPSAPEGMTGSPVVGMKWDRVRLLGVFSGRSTAELGPDTGFVYDASILKEWIGVP